MTVEPGKKKLYFAILNSGWLRREFMSTQLPEMNRTEGVELVWENPEKSWGHPIYSNRNAIVQRFLRTDCDYLMMQDDDIIPWFNPAIMVWMDKDIIGSPAKVRQNGQQINWVAFVHDPKRDGYYAVDMATAPNADLIPVDIVGTGLICIKRHVIEEMVKKFPGPFTVINDEHGICKWGTDFAFCKRAREIGFEVYTTPHHVCEHMKEGGLLEGTGYDDSDYFCHDNTRYGLYWGDWAIIQKDWTFIKEIFQKYGIKRVAEFGSGLSSFLMSERAEVVSYETAPKEIERLAPKITPANRLEIRLWDGRSPVELAGFDLVFIDGPPGGVGCGRKYSYESAAKSGAKFILTHDSGREGEIGYAKEYLWKDYEVVGTNGTHQQKCELWMKK
jgi:hypothetical protein